MATHAFIPVLGKRLRVTRLDNCGNPPEASAEDALIATDGFINVSLSAEVEDGNEIIVRKADGSLCVNERMSNSFKRFNVRSEEHTSELQSRENLVCRLLLEKKKIHHV